MNRHETTVLPTNETAAGDRFARIRAAALHGVDARPVEVEVHARGTSPGFDLLGLSDAAGRAAADRVRSALASAGYPFPKGRVVVNLAPAELPKSGAVFDLAIALGLLAVDELVDREALASYLVLGELSLDGLVRPVRGAFVLASAADAPDCTGLLVAAGAAEEASLATERPVFAVERLSEAVGVLNRQLPATPVTPRTGRRTRPTDRDFVDVRGQESVKEALVVAAAGGHNLLLSGPPGAGKSLLAERFPDILPPLGRSEGVEVAALRSAAGLPVRSLPTVRPLRAPSCGASAAGVLGGGRPPRPGEVTLAHRGVLFLDELPHFRGDVLEGLRQPMEAGETTLSRAGSHFTFPARFQLLAAMNPCPCGHAGTSRCTCSPSAVERYVRRLSAPLLDRIDLRVHVRQVDFEQLRGGEVGMSTAAMAARVAAARAVQEHRYRCPVRTNATLGPREITRHCRVTDEAEELLRRAMDTGSLTARGVARVLRVARTICDLAGADGGGAAGDVPELIDRDALLRALRWRNRIAGG